MAGLGRLVGSDGALETPVGEAPCIVEESAALYGRGLGVALTADGVDMSATLGCSGMPEVMLCRLLEERGERKSADAPTESRRGPGETRPDHVCSEQ